jgi:TRL-like protein family
MRALRRSLLAACLLLPGCGWGLVFTHIVVPLDIDADNAPAQEMAGKSDWRTFSYMIHVDWNTSAIADAAHAAGITRIYYADMEILSILGIWTTQTAIVYGTGPGLPVTPPPKVP